MGAAGVVGPMLISLTIAFGGIDRAAAKRLLAATALVCCTAGSAAAQVVDSCHVVDVDGDGAVSAADVEQVDALVGGGYAPREDLDGDGAVTAADRSLVQSYCPDPTDPQCGGQTPCGLVCALDFDDSGDLGEGDREAILATFGHPCNMDLNRDGFICPRDMVALEGYLATFEGLPGPLPPGAQRADFNHDGSLDAQDLDELRQFLLNLGDKADPTCSRDLDRDGTIGLDDVMALLGAWNECQPPARAVTKPDQCNTADIGDRARQRSRSW